LRAQQPLAEPVRLQAAKLELRDEWVSAPWVQQVSGRLERRLEQASALASWEQFLEPQAQ